MKASICITAYNHEPYIERAVEGALMQETDFEYEVIIGEDDSSDRTREIVQSYKEKFPDRIRLFLNDRENVIYINGRPTGRWNYTNNLKHARGKYIAILDGDDYWTDPSKLQKQVEHLEANPEMVISFHQVAIHYEDERPSKRSYPQGKTITTIEDLAQFNYIHSASCMFRNGLVTDLPPGFFKCAIGDWALYLLLAQYGTIGHLPEVMGVHRVHSKGIWEHRSKRDRLVDEIQTRDIIKSWFDGPVQSIISKTMLGFIKTALEHEHIGADKENVVRDIFLKNWPRAQAACP